MCWNDSSGGKWAGWMEGRDAVSAAPRAMGSWASGRAMSQRSQSAVMESGPLEVAQLGRGGGGQSSRRQVPPQPPLEASVGAAPGSLGPEHWTLVLVLRGCWKLGLEMLVCTWCLLPSSRAQHFAREGEDE